MTKMSVRQMKGTKRRGRLFTGRPQCAADAADVADRARSVDGSPWTDADDEAAATLRRHQETFDNFNDNIQVFVDGFRDAAVAAVADGRIAAVVANVRLGTMARDMRTQLDRLNRMVAAADIACAARERDRGRFAADTGRSLADAHEEHVDALRERFAREFGSIMRPAGPTAAVRSSPPQDGTAGASSVCSSPVAVMTDAAEPAVHHPHGLLPGFLAALKPHGGRATDPEWCRGCRAPTALVPAHWSDSFHRALHALRAAVPPPAAFATGASEVRTVDAGRRPAYRVLRVDPDRYDDGPVRSVREYVNVELGVNECGVRPFDRLVYLTVTARCRGTAVIGYLETEPVTEAYALGADGRPSRDDRRAVKRGVSRIWVAVGHRRRRLGTNMLDAFRADHRLRGRDVAFASHEILAGDAFVRHYVTAAARGQDAAVLIYTRSPAWYR